MLWQHTHRYEIFGHTYYARMFDVPHTVIWLACRCGPQSITTVTVIGQLNDQDIDRAGEIWRGRSTRKHRSSTDTGPLDPEDFEARGNVPEAWNTIGKGDR